jgi:hypothetical protein
MADRNPFTAKISQALSKFLTSTMTPIRTTEFRRPGDAAGYISKMYFDLLIQSQSRKDKYDKFDYLDKNLAEATAALNIYADNIVSGSIGGEENYKVVIDKGTPGKAKIESVIIFNEQKSRIKDYIWEISRDVTKFGDNYQEVVIGEREGQNYIHKLKKLPEKEIFANVDERGVVQDLTKPYFQQENDSSEKIPFDWWRLIHFKIGNEIYGVDRSLFGNASNRIGRQLLWIDESLVIARMSRAWQRFVYMIDTTGMDEETKWNFIDRFLERQRRNLLVDPATGRLRPTDRPPMPDEDIAIPIGEGDKTDLKIVSGDLNIGNIKDVSYIQNKFLMAVSVPKAYMAIEEGVRSKSTLGQIDIQFARQVRRKQRALLPGLRKFYEIVFILNAIDHTQFKWDIVFPELSTTDEMMKWTMMKIRVETAKILSVDIGAVNDEYIYDVILQLTDKEKELYKTEIPDFGAGGGGGFPPEAVRTLRKDPYVRQLVNNLRDMIQWRLAQNERMKDDMEEIGVDREKDLRNTEEEE